jgi:5-deoxy-glucuronate isomerase
MPEVEITPESAGWGFSGLRIVALQPAEEHTFETGDDELIVLPLNGAATVRVGATAHEVTSARDAVTGREPTTAREETSARDAATARAVEFTLHGRESVFSAVSDFVYVPRDSRVSVTSERGGRFALPSARADRRLEARYVAAQDVPVELRGAGQASRQVNNFCSPEAFEADRLIAVEVLTPGGNWSSYPPHKHDEDIPGRETVLEEIYYYEVADGGFGYQRVYGSGPGREIDITREVRSGDYIVMPHGYHGPSMAAPGYDLYYLNVMAGPGERAWRFTDDPAHAWIRDTWAEQELDPRLPMTRSTS